MTKSKIPLKAGKLFILVILLLVSIPNIVSLSNYAFAQVDTAWVRRYPGPGSNNWRQAKFIAVDGSGNVYVAGWNSGGGTSDDYITIKYYPNGDTGWVRRYNGSGNHIDRARAIAVDDSCNVYVTGYSLGSGTSYDYATIKYYPNGDTAWVRRYNSAGDFGDAAYAIGIDASGNIYVTGFISHHYPSDDYGTIKYDPNGNELWVRTFNRPEDNLTWDYYHPGIAVDASGNAYVTGNVGTGHTNNVIIKYYPNGDTAWVRTFEGIPGDFTDNIAIDSSGNVYVCGGIVSGWGYSYRTVKYDQNGNELWWRVYNPGCCVNVAQAISADDSSNVYVTGTSECEGACYYEYATIKYDANGNELWVRRYSGPGGLDEDATLTIDGYSNVYVTGASYGNGTGFDYATVKYDPNGNELWVQRYDGGLGWSEDLARAIVVDNSRNVYVTGLSENDFGGYNYATIKYVQSGESQPFYFVHITDPHVLYNPILCPHGGQTWSDLLDTIKTWNPLPDFVLCSGDLVEFGAGELATPNWEKLLEPLYQTEYGTFYLDQDHTIPIYFCPGNHDAHPVGIWWPGQSFGNYYTYVGPDCYLRLHKSCAMFSMNSGKDIVPWAHWPVNPPEGDGLDDYYYSDEVTWLLNNLDALDGEYNNQDNSQYCKIIMMHHPYKNPGGDPLDGVFWNNRDAFINACVAFFDVDAVVCGHLHESGSISNSDAQPWQEGNGTRFIITNAIVHDASYRKIYISPTGEIESIINGRFRSTISGEVACRTVMHIYDDKGNHDGPDGNGDIEILIPGSYYSYWVVDTLGINATYTEFSLYKEDTTDYTLVIESLSDDSMNISLFTSLVSGLSSEATYTAVPVDSGSVATLYAYGSEFDYTLYIDDDGDGVPDREVQPDSTPYYRGDANGDGAIDIADVVYLVNYLFIDGPAPSPLEAGDANCDGKVDIADVVYLVNYLFIEGPPPGCE